ncbi:MAG: ABC transporter permease [Archangium sp.]|nr:ABC transporter permease [Archangium sp.]
MRRYVLRRLLLMIPTFLGITLLTFVVAQLAPGDPFQLDLEVAGPNQAVIEQQRTSQGLDAPLPLQFGRWLWRVVRFDFGRSFIDQRDVTEKVGEAAPRTALIAGLALLFGFGLAVPLGVLLATRARRWWARALSVLLIAAWSVPTFWVAVILLMLFAGPRYFDWFPVQGLADGGFVLPVICLTWPTLVVATRQVRSAMEDALAQDYVKAARARGIPEGRVIWRHALRNSLLPVVTMLGLHLPHLVGGSVVIERIFGIPGMGLLAFDAIGTRDYPTVMGVATVIAIVTMLSMLLVDLAYGVIDPRIRLERT